MRKIAVISICIFAGLALGLALFGPRLASPYLKSFILRTYAENFNSTLGIAELSINPFLSRVNLKQVRIEGKGGRRANPILIIKEAHLVYSPLALLSKTLFFKEIRLIEPAASANLTESGSLDLINLLTPKESAKTGVYNFNVALGSIKLKKGDFKLYYPQKDLSTSLDQFSGQASLDKELGLFLIEAETGALIIRLGNRAVRFDSLILKGSADAAGLEIKSLKLYKGEKPLSMSDLLRNFASGQTSEQFLLEDDPEFYSWLFTVDTDFSGAIEFKGRAQDLLSRPKFEGEIISSELKIKGATLSGIKGALSYKDGRLIIDKALAKIFGGDFSARAEVDFNGSTRRSGTPYKISSKFDSARFESILTLFLKKGAPQIRAPLRGELFIEGIIEDSSTLKGQGRLEVQDSRDKLQIEGWPFGKISSLKASFTSTIDGLRFDPLVLSGYGFELNAAGGLDFHGDLSLSTKVSIELAKALEGKKIADGLLGDFSFDGVTTGNIKNPIAHGLYKANGFKILRYETKSSGELTVGVGATSLKNNEVWLDDSIYMVDGTFFTAAIVRTIVQESPELIIDTVDSARVTLQRANIKSIVGRYNPGSPVQGIGSGTAIITGADGRAKAEIKGEVASGALWGIGLDAFAGKFVISKTGIKFGPFETVLKTGKVSVGGEVDFKGRLNLELASGPVELKKLAQYFYGPIAVDGQVSMRGALRGTIDRPELTQNFAVGRSSIYGEELNDLKGSVNVNLEGVKIEGFEFRSAGGKVSGSGGYNPKAGLRIGFKAASIELQKMKSITSQQIPLKGSVSADGEIRLRPGLLAGGASMRFDRAYIFDQPIRGLTAKAELLNTDVKFQLINGAIMNGAISGSGKYAPPVGLSLDISVRGAEFSELTLPEDLKPPLSGKVDLFAEIAAAKDGLKGRFIAEGSSVKAQGIDLSKFKATGDFTGAGVHLSSFRAMAKDIPFEATGSLSFSGPYEFALKVSKDALGDVTSAPFSAEVEMSARGDLGINKRPLRGKALIRDMKSYGIGFGDSTAQFQLEGDKVIFSGSALKRIDYRGEISMAPGLPFKLEATAADLSPGVLLKSIGLRQIEKIGGRIAGDIWLGGNLGDNSPITGRGVFKTFDVEITSYEFKNNGDIELSLSGDGVKILRANFKGKDTDFSITGQANFSGKIVIQMNGASQLSILTAYLPYMQGAEGPVEVGLSIWGDAKSPSLDGQIELKNSVMKLTFVEEPIKRIRGKIKFDFDKISIPRIEADYSGGNIEMFGSLSVSGLSIERYNISLNAQNIDLFYPQNLSSNINAVLRLHGEPGSETLSGQVLVARSRYRSDMDLKSLFVSYKAAGPADPSGMPFNYIKMDISLATVDNFLAATSFADMELKGDFNLRGTIGKPSLLGRAYIEKGQILFRDKKFVIQQGIIDFIDPLKVVPYFDIKAGTDINKYFVNLSISGTPDNFDLKLISLPELDEFNIISLITVGKTMEDAFKNPDLLAATEAANIIGGQFKEDVEKRIGGALGLSRLDLSPAYIESKKSVRPRVSVGKNVTKDLTLSYSTNIGVYQERQIQVEYKLTESISLLGTKTETKSAGIDLKFSFSFR